MFMAGGKTTLEPTGSRAPRRFFFKKKFKVDFFFGKTKSAFDDKYTLILVILSYLFILSHFF